MGTKEKKLAIMKEVLDERQLLYPRIGAPIGMLPKLKTRKELNPLSKTQLLNYIEDLGSDRDNLAHQLHVLTTQIKFDDEAKITLEEENDGLRGEIRGLKSAITLLAEMLGAKDGDLMRL